MTYCKEMKHNPDKLKKKTQWEANLKISQNDKYRIDLF